ncbi:DUF6538 domain-containing protein [Sulfitobacter sp. D35]|uniref:DUF6538 domain-containing protein n=1 Tax=Sulfitobacter sp. D35 TaxID=3083252 RepID=UPI002970027A|nr:DUF6538 domain-containing protein [Sulfitobacter sp. D35]MDW4497270.1 DUF6538 domain-containing protein [Sulfitobacter sp. D35]
MNTPKLRGSVWSVWERVPADVVEKAQGKAVPVTIGGEQDKILLTTHAKKSLGTKDKGEAKLRYHEVSVALQRFYEGLRNGPQMITERQAAALAGDYYRSLVQQYGDNPGDPERWETAMDPLVEVADEEADISHNQRGKLLERLHGAEADRWLGERGMTVDGSSRDLLLTEFNRAALDACETLRKRAVGDWTQDTKADRFPSWMPPTAAKGAAPAVAQQKTGVTGEVSGGTSNSLLTLHGIWEEQHEKSGGRLKGRRGPRMMVEAFIAYAGHSDATRITYIQAQAWASSLRDGEKPKAARTVNDTYVAHLKAILNQPEAKRMLGGGNPFSGVSVKAEKKTKLRSQGFTSEEAVKVLRAAMAVSLEGKRSTEQKAKSRRWLPPMLAHTGARVGELAQLRKDDLKQTGEVCWLRLTPEAGSVKSGIYRDVPLHPQLVVWGLVEWIKGSPDGPLFYSPSGKGRDADLARRDKCNQHTADLVREAGVSDIAQPNHGWRHRWKTVARSCGIGSDWQRAIQGHSGGAVDYDYGEFEIEPKFEMISKMPWYQL